MHPHRTHPVAYSVLIALLVGCLMAAPVAFADDQPARAADAPPLEAPSTGLDVLPDPAAVKSLPPELLRIQQNLGGSVINQFPALHPVAEASPLQPHLSPPPSVTVAPPAITVEGRSTGCTATALRAAAADLDAAANRLEQFELYEQADALRAQAQRLRKDARKLPRPSGAGSDSGVAPVWQPGMTPPYPTYQAPTESAGPRRFGWELPSNPSATGPDDPHIPRDPELGKRQKNTEPDRG